VILLYQTNPKLIRAIIAYVIGIIFLYLSVFLSQRIKYNGHFISAIPIVLPLVFAIAFFSISVIFVLTREYPWLFRTGMMSLVSGITMLAFGIVAYDIKIPSIVWAGSIGIGVLFTIAAIARLLIHGGLSAYRKAKN
jgi:hypothetical protein